MTPHDHALELVALALEDLNMARSTAPDPGAPDRGVGCHPEQTVEKLLKALPAEKNLDYPRTHRLDRLMELGTRHGYSVPDYARALGLLTSYAVAERYTVRPSEALDRPTLLTPCRTAAGVDRRRAPCAVISR